MIDGVLCNAAILFQGRRVESGNAEGGGGAVLYTPLVSDRTILHIYMQHLSEACQSLKYSKMGIHQYFTASNTLQQTYTAE